MKSIVKTASLATYIAVGLAQPARAEDQPAKEVAENSHGKEIVVIARKREENLQDVPIAVTVFSGEELERNGVKSFNDFALGNPNVRIEAVQGSAGISSGIAIRGNIQGASTLQVDPSVGTYIDGHLISHTFGTVALTADIESVQTLKGPQGTLFGRNTTGGAMLIRTRDPVLDEVSGFVQAELGGVKTRRFGGAINVPLGDIAAFRFVYQNNSTGDFQFFSDGRSLGSKNEELLRAKLLVQPTDGTEIVLTAEKSREESRTTLDIPTHPNAPRYRNVPITSGPGGNGTSPVDARTNDELAEYDGEFYGLRVTQDIDSGNVKLIVGHRRYDISSALTLPPFLGYTFQDKPDNKDFAAELQYNGSLLNERLDLSAGLFYFDETIHEDQNTFLYSGTQRTSRLLTATSKSKSGYIQGTGHLTSEVNLTVGLRYTDDKKTGLLLSSTLGAGFSGDVAARSLNAPAIHEQTQSKVNYLVTVDYKPADDILFYASHSTGYRSGGSSVDRIAENQPANPDYLLTAFFLPESVKNYEAGFKTQYWDRRLTLNGAAFYQEYGNYQYQAIDPVTITRVTLNTDAIIKGFELDGKVQLDTGTALSANVGYVDAKVSDSMSPSDGSSLSYIPKWTWSANLSQNVEIGGGELDLVANYSWRDKFWSSLNDPLAPGDEEATSTIDSRGLLNLSATYTNGPYMIAVFAENVTNEKYHTYISYAGGGAINFGSIGKPRVIGARARFSF